MGDLKSARLMYVKAWLFLLAGLMAAAGILVELPSVRVAALLVIAVWSFCRLYYFLFYVIEKYIDREFRFAGVWTAALHVIRGRGSRTDRESRRES